MGHKVILTGATGMVGEGVLYECLNHDEIEKVLIVNRRPLGLEHPKLVELIHHDFYNLESIKESLAGYDSCLFCLGVSSVGLSADNYYKMTYTLTLNFAKVLSELNPEMTFCYVSGSGTDSTENGKIRWANVKGKTENELMKLPFKAVYAFRPAFLQPTKGQKNVKSIFKFISWMYPAIKVLLPNYVSSLAELGQAMIKSITEGYDRKILEVRDILQLNR